MFIHWLSGASLPLRNRASGARSWFTAACVFLAACSAPIDDSDVSSGAEIGAARQALEDDDTDDEAENEAEDEEEDDAKLPRGRQIVDSLPEKHPSGEDLVRVIVTLKGDFKFEGDIDKSEILAQRERIKKAQERIAEALGAKLGKPDAKATARITHQYTTVPGIALQLTKNAREVLKSLPDVADVRDDYVMAPMAGASVGPSRVDSLRANLSVERLRGAGQVVAILDSGVDRDHPYLGTDRFVATACFSSKSWWGNDEETLCPNGEDRQSSGGGENCVGMKNCRHGTNMAGIIGGFIDENGNGRLDAEDRMGVAPAVKFVSIQVYYINNTKAECDLTDEKPPCIRSHDSSVIAALDHVGLLQEEHNIVASNLSFGSGTYFAPCDGEFTAKWAVDNLRSKKIATIAASGNEPRRDGEFREGIAFPACISTVVSVGATEIDDSVARDFSQVASHLSLLAPGRNIETSRSGTRFELIAGTSAAAPHVAGAWALMREHRARTGDSTTVSSILTRLRQTGRDRTDSRVDRDFPRIDVVGALGIPVASVSFDRPAIYLPTSPDGPYLFEINRKNFTHSVVMLPKMVRADTGAIATDDFVFTPEEEFVTGDQVEVRIERKLHVFGDYKLTMNLLTSGVSLFGTQEIPVTAYVARPVVTGISPVSGPPTTIVTFEGENFSTLTRVTFRGSSPVPPLIVVSPTRMQVKVPLDAITGGVRVENHDVRALAMLFTVTTEPVINSVTPSHAPAGTPVTVTGANFFAGTTVHLDQTPVSNLVRVDPGTLTFVIPTGATAGPLRIRSNGTTVTAPFTIGYPVPILSNFAPLTGHTGQTLTIHGDGFYGPLVKVRFGNVAALNPSVSRTEITVPIPPGVPDNTTISVQTAGGTVTSTQHFQTNM
jgi:subtilisin family serine protease